MNHMTLAIKTFIRKLKSINPKLAKAVIYYPNADYSKDGIKINTKIPLPHIYLTGPSIKKNAELTSNEKPQIIDNELEKFVTYREEEAKDLIFDAVLVSDSTIEMSDLVYEISSYMQYGRKISVMRDYEDPARGNIDYEIDIEREFIFGKMYNNSSLKESTASLIIRGVHFSSGEVFEKGRLASDIGVDMSNHKES